MPIAKELNTSMANLSLAWALKNKNVTVILLGARNADQLKTTLKCQSVSKKLNKDIMNKIEKILNNKPIPDPILYNTFGRQKRNISKL